MILRAIKAKHGDSILLLGDGAQVLIDGGPSGVYNQTLRSQLQKLERDGEDQPRIDLLIVSHIDADHIDGVLDLTAEILEARDEEREPIVRIDRAWHNSFADTIAKSVAGKSSSVKAAAASIASAIEDLDIPGLDMRDSKLVLSSVAQGRQLRLDLKALNVDLNKRFANQIALQKSAVGPWKIGDINLTVIGPTQDEVDKLKTEWIKQLEILDRNGTIDLASGEGFDTSVSNLASIVVIAESHGKKALLTGDARGDMILRWLEKTEVLKPNESVHFDILKLPHHGSDRNVTPEFFKRVTADQYLVSGNGGHGNPEPNTFEMLFEARPNLDYEIHMTYSPDELRNNKAFVKAGNVERFDKVFNTDKRRNIRTFPKAK